MSEVIRNITSPEEITSAMAPLRRAALEGELPLQTVFEIFEKWAAALDDRDTREIPGVTFLRLWLRRGTLEPILVRELGPTALSGHWLDDGHTRLQFFPLWGTGRREILRFNPFCHSPAPCWEETPASCAFPAD
jgi:hypothetical protein